MELVLILIAAEVGPSATIEPAEGNHRRGLGVAPPPANNPGFFSQRTTTAPRESSCGMVEIYTGEEAGPPGPDEAEIMLSTTPKELLGGDTKLYSSSSKIATPRSSTTASLQQENSAANEGRREDLLLERLARRETKTFINRLPPRTRDRIPPAVEAQLVWSEMVHPTMGASARFVLSHYGLDRLLASGFISDSLLGDDSPLGDESLSVTNNIEDDEDADNSTTSSVEDSPEINKEFLDEEKFCTRNSTSRSPSTRAATPSGGHR